MAATEERIRVVVRVRPMSAPSQKKTTAKKKGGPKKGRKRGPPPKKKGTKGAATKAKTTAAATTPPWIWDTHSISDTRPESSRDKPYSFDEIFEPESQTVDIYNGHIDRVVDDAVHGINGTVFCYGQTGSGKTFTMLGSPSDPGIIRLATRNLFEKVGAAPSADYVVSVSYLEIYNEKVKDLLSAKKKSGDLEVFADPTEGVIIKGLVETPVASEEDCLRALSKGEQKRHFRATNMNLHSSRSHTIFRLKVIGTAEDGVVSVAVLNLIDLAGSECVGTAATTGKGRKEGAAINRSLLTLVRIMDDLAAKSTGHLPFRESKLTRLLQPALIGNSRITIVATVDPHPTKVKQTHSTLVFAAAASTVQKAGVSRNMIPDTLRSGEENAELLVRYQAQFAELTRLRAENEAFKAEIARLKAALAEAQEAANSAAAEATAAAAAPAPQREPSPPPPEPEVEEVAVEEPVQNRESPAGLSTGGAVNSAIFDPSNPNYDTALEQEILRLHALLAEKEQSAPVTAEVVQPVTDPFMPPDRMWVDDPPNSWKPSGFGGTMTAHSRATTKAKVKRAASHGEDVGDDEGEYTYESYYSDEDEDEEESSEVPSEYESEGEEEYSVYSDSEEEEEEGEYEEYDDDDDEEEESDDDDDDDDIDPDNYEFEDEY